MFLNITFLPTTNALLPFSVVTVLPAPSTVTNFPYLLLISHVFIVTLATTVITESLLDALAMSAAWSNVK